MDDQTDFQRWLGASGYPLDVAPEAWQRRSEPPAEAIVLLEADSERWPQTVLRVAV